MMFGTGCCIIEPFWVISIIESVVECGDGHSTLVTILSTLTTVPGFGTVCGNIHHCVCELCMNVSELV